jgi:predicted RNA-binding protein YlqC (UPF0109 family)
VSDTADEATDSAGEASYERTLAVVNHLATSLVDEPDEVKVSLDLEHPTPRVNVSAADGEIGRLIGKRGRTAMAIRAVGRAAAAKDGAHVDIEFLD